MAGRADGRSDESYNFRRMGSHQPFEQADRKRINCFNINICFADSKVSDAETPRSKNGQKEEEETMQMTYKRLLNILGFQKFKKTKT